MKCPVCGACLVRIAGLFSVGSPTRELLVCSRDPMHGEWEKRNERLKPCRKKGNS